MRSQPPRRVERRASSTSAHLDDNLSVESILEALRQELPRLKTDFGVRSIGIFGSRVHGNPRPDSDLDVLVELGDKQVSLFGFSRLRNELTDLLGVPVDFVDRNGLKFHIGQRVLANVRMA